MFEEIKTNRAPKPIGPYVQGSKNSTIIYISGQIALNELHKTIPENVVDQTKKVLLNIKEILEKGKFYVNNIIKTTIFITDLAYIKDINKVYEEFFLKNKAMFPARSCVQVQKLPYGAKIEMEAIAMNFKKNLN